MAKKFGFLTPAIVLAGLGAGVALAPVASALPQCVTTAPYTTQCTTGGSNQIITSPPLVQSNNYGWGVFGTGGPIIVIGR
jgi:hypothetical protein